MSNVDRVEVSRSAVSAILQDPKILADLKARAERIAAAAGTGFEVDSRVGNRARASVRTATPQARAREARDHSLVRALDAGR